MTPAEINRKLIEVYGLSLDGNPKYKLVWSENETEKRRRTISSSGQVIEEVREVPKYSYVCERWILEVYVPTDNDELTTKISYEPLWVFQDKNGNYLPPVWPAIEIIIQAMITREKKPPRSEKQDIYDEAIEFEAAKRRNLDHINAARDSDETEKVRAGMAMYNPYNAAKEQPSE